MLGNHDTIRMVPRMEAMGVRVLLNESLPLNRAHEVVHLAGIDDAHYFRTHGYHKAADGIPADACAILLSHTPEAAADGVPADACAILLSHTPEGYRAAAHCGFDLMLCGHTHGGQICLPGGVPILTDSDAPRAYARGAWRFESMQGYTSVGCGLHLGGLRLVGRRRAAELPARDHAASTALRGSVGPIAQPEAMRHARRGDRQAEERERDGSNQRERQVQHRLHDEQREQGLGDLVQPGGLAARSDAEPALDETRKRVAQHRGRADDQAQPQRKAEHERGGAGGGDRCEQPAQGLGGAEQRPSVEEAQPAVQRRAPACSEDALGDDRGRVGHAEEQQQAHCEPEGIHVAMVTHLGAGGAAAEMTDKRVAADRGAAAPPAEAAAAPPASPIEQLSPRERDILRGIACDASHKEIARDLGMAETTVTIHVQHVLRKLGLGLRVQAAVRATARGQG